MGRGKKRERQWAGKEQGQMMACWGTGEKDSKERAERQKRAEGMTCSQGFLVLLSLLTSLSNEGLVQTPTSSLPTSIENPLRPQFGCPLPLTLLLQGSHRPD